MKTNPFNILTDETFNEKKDIKNNLLRVLAEGEDELIVPDGWDSIQYLIRNNLHSKVFHVGDELICQRGGKEIAWTIIGIDEENIEDPQFNHSLTLQTKDIIDENIPFDVREALFYFSEGLPVGTYYFTIKKQPWYHDDIGKSFMFTLENSIPAGGQLVIQNNYNETCAHSNINSYSSSNSIIPIEEAEMTIWDGETGIFLGNIDIIVQDNINSIERALKGSNNYKESFIRQWLNSNGDMNIIWKPQSIFDRLSSSVDNLQGFMKDLDEDFLRVVKKSNIDTLKKIITKDTTSIGFNSNLELSNYRIYGNTVDGESVGDRTGNLWDETIIQGGTNNAGTIIDGNPKRLRSDYIFVEPGETYSFASNLKIRIIYSYDDNDQKVSIIRDAPNGDVSYTFTVPNAATKIIITVMKRIDNVEYDITPDDFEWGQLEKGSVVTSYEPYGYRVPVTVEGKNLCNNIWEQKVINAEMGNPAPAANVVCCDFIPVKPNVTYSCSRTIANNYNNLRCYGANKNYLGSGDGLANKTNPLKQGELFGTFMITDARVSYIRFNDISNSLDTKYMLVEGVYTAETMPPYEPYHVPVTTNLYLPEQIKMVGDEAEYVDYGAQKQHRVRKNLLQNTATSQTINGVTFTVNNDGGVTCNGTVSEEMPIGVNAQFFVPTITLPAGKYILSGCPAGGSENTTFKQLISANKVWLGNDKGSGFNFILTDAGKVSVRIIIYPGYTCNNLTFYPMIRKSGIEDDTYEPYIENTELDVELPALPTLLGTNILSVETEVKPSEIYLYQNTIETIKDYFFLPSKMQIYGENNSIQNTEGNFYSYYYNYSSLFEPSDEADINRIKYVEGLSSQWITRTEGNNNSDIYTVTENGELSLIDIDASYGVAPICIVY